MTNEIKIINISIGEIEPNIGQINGLKANPRKMDKDKFEQLKDNITKYPKMLNYRSLMVYPYNGKYVIIGGNMRYYVLKELGYTEASCVIISASTPIEDLEAYIIIDNNTFGNWDWDELANNWDAKLLESWGLDVWQDVPEEAEEDLLPKADNNAKSEDCITVRCNPGDVWIIGGLRLDCGDIINLDEIKLAIKKLIAQSN